MNYFYRLVILTLLCLGISEQVNALPCPPNVPPGFSTIYRVRTGVLRSEYYGEHYARTPLAAAEDFMNWMIVNDFPYEFAPPLPPPGSVKFIELIPIYSSSYWPYEYHLKYPNVERWIFGGFAVVDECRSDDQPPPPPPIPLGCASGEGGFFVCPGNSPPTGTPNGPAQNSGAPGPAESTSADPTAPSTWNDSAGSNDGSGSGAGSAGSNSCKPADAVGDPILASTGNVYTSERDYASPVGLNFVRSYNSSLAGWVHNFQLRIIANDTQADVVRPDGRIYSFAGSGAGVWAANGTVVEQLIKLSPASVSDPSWKFITAQGTVELYDANGMPNSITWRGGRSMSFTANGHLLLTATDNFGHGIRFAYDSQNRLTGITTPEGVQISYGYDGQGRLALVTYPDNTTRKYLYENASQPLLLTGIIDESGNRFASWSYDSQGRATSGTQAAGANSVQLSYGASAATSATTQVTDALGVQRTLQFANVSGRSVFAGQNQPCTNCYGDAASNLVDPATGMITQSTDYLGSNNLFTNDPARKLVLAITKAASRPEAQTTSITWHPTFRLPAVVTEAGRSTAYGYDAAGNLTGQAVTDTTLNQTRNWAWTYNAQAQVTSVTDPLNRVTSYAYDASGNNTRMTNALGQATSLAYDAAGRVTQLTDPNGRVMAFAYDLRGRLLSRSATPAGGGTAELDRFAYTVSGLLQQAQLANGLTLSYSYDAAQRLIGVADSLGNTVAYTLDGLGNRTSTSAKDAAGNLALQRGAIINSLNRIAAITGAQGQTLRLDYDANGEPISQTDPNNNTTAQALDALRRPLAQTFADAASASLAYNALDQRTAAKDPKGVQTGYSVNAFGNVLIQSSPDIGTVRNTYDGAGNLSQSADARGVVSSYSYDGLNRVTQISSIPGTSSAAIAPMVTNFTYDSAPQGIGRLAQVSDPSGTTAYAYDGLGRIASKVQSLRNGESQTLRYTYAAGGQIASISYPSGRIVSYQSAAGRVTGISMAASSKDSVKPFISAITYTALGQAKSWAWASGDAASRTFDADGRMAANELASYSFDPASRITDISQNLYAAGGALKATRFKISYDRRDRVIAFQQDSAADTFAYDANGNRTLSTSTVQTSDGDHDADNIAVTSQRQWNVDPASNRLLGFTLQMTRTNPQGKTESSTSTSVNYGIDVVGNQTTDGRKTYGIDASGRFATLSQGTGRDRQSMLYLHNALGQRVFKSEFTSEDYEPSEEDLGKDYVTWLKSRFGWMFAAKKDERMKLGTAYVYDEDGNIMGETGNGGARSNGTTDYIWLPTPAGTRVLVGAVVNGNSYAVHTDHSGTPRRLTDAQNKPAWQLAYSAFGDNAPTTAQNHFKPTAAMSEGEDKKAALTFNLRFPGQYFDAESGLSYNYFRSYDARTGRYTQSDPIGLNGGWNRFSYVEGNALSYSDSYGLQPVPSGMFLPRMPAVTAPPSMATNNGIGTAQSIMQQFTNMPNPAPALPDGYTGINVPWTMPNLKQVCVRCAGGDGLPQSCPRIDSPKMSVAPDTNTCVCIEYKTVVVP